MASGLKRKNLKRDVKLLLPIHTHEPRPSTANKLPPRATSSVLSFKYVFKDGIGMFGTPPGQVQRALHTGNLRVTFHGPCNFKSWAPSPSCLPNNATGRNAICIKMTASVATSIAFKVILMIVFSLVNSQN